MAKKYYVFSLVLITLLTQSVFAVGALYARRPNTNNNYQPLWLKTYDVNVKIIDQMAVTHVDQTFKNETTQRLEGIFIFPLPKNAIVMELILWINGKPVQGKVMDSDTARTIYENIVKKTMDPALLESLGDNIFKLSVFPIDPNGSLMSERRIELTYAELLPYDNGTIDYSFFMKSVNLSSKAVQRASLDVKLVSQKDIVSLMSPSHSAATGLVVHEISKNEYTITYGEENTHAEKNFNLSYDIKNDVFDINHLTYVPNTDSAMFIDSTGDDSYFVVWITPPDSVSQSQIIKKNIVFVADISSSMAGERIVQLRASLNAMVDMLNPGDFFNIIAFNTSTVPFKSDVVGANATNLGAAHNFINELGEVGMTNMEEAFATALESTWDDTSMNVVVFLTDGKPTWPINTTPESVIKTVAKKNSDSVSIFAFGIGEEPEESFLKLLARSNGGYEQMIMQDDSVNKIMQHFMTRISFPLIKNIAIDYAGLDKYDLFPKIMPNLYAGTQLTVLGRYRNKGTFPIMFNGKVGSRPFSLANNLPFPSTTPNHPFVARMWASTKIDYLLEQIDMYGAQTELVNGVKNLGKKYGIITPYTSFLVVEPVHRVVLDKTMLMSSSFILFANSPNPFSATTTIRFSVPKSVQAKQIEMKVFDLRGKLVTTLMNEMTIGGNYAVNWDGKDSAGKAVGTGFYIAMLKVGTETKMITMKLVR